MNHYQTGSMGLLKPIQRLLDSPQISEILVNEPGKVWYDEAGKMNQIEVPAFTSRHLDNFFTLVANDNHQVINKVNPMLSGSLPDKSRIQLVLPPTASSHAISIRRKVLKRFELEQYQRNGYFSHAETRSLGFLSSQDLPEADQMLMKLYLEKDFKSFIKTAIKARKNLIISGGTHTGKTTFTNACLQEIDLDERIIILEDTREIEIPHPNQVRLLATKGDQGTAKVSMQDLVQCCLRLRPDRIIMGELRGKEVWDFVTACSTGHEGSITTLHANSPRGAFLRLAGMYKQNNVPSMTDVDIIRELDEIIDIIVQIEKHPVHGRIMSSLYYRYGELAEHPDMKSVRPASVQLGIE